MTCNGKLSFLILAVFCLATGAGISYLWSWLWINNYNNLASVLSFLIVITVVGCLAGTIYSIISICDIWKYPNDQDLEKGHEVECVVDKSVTKDEHTMLIQEN
jgi:uncharacterized membrane protein